MPTNPAWWLLVGGLAAALVATLLVVRAAKVRESATVRLLNDLQSHIREAAISDGLPLKLGPLTARNGGVGNLVVWDLLGQAPAVLTSTEDVILSKHERLLADAMSSQEPIHLGRARPDTGPKRFGLAAVMGQPGEPMVGFTFFRTRAFSPQEISLASMLSRLVGESLEHMLEQRRSAVLRELVDAVDNAGNVAQVVQVAIDLLAGATEGLLTALFRYDRGVFKPEVIAGKVPAELREYLMEGFPAGEGLTWDVYRTGEAVFLEEYSHHPAAMEELLDQGLKAIALVPLEPRAGSRRLLAVGGTDPKRWTPHDRELIERFRQVLRLLVRQRTSEERLAAVMQLERELVVTELEQLPEKLLDAAVRMVPGAEAGSLLVREGPVFRFAAVHGAALPELDDLEFTEEEMLQWYGQGRGPFLRGEPRLAVATDHVGLVDEYAPGKVVELVAQRGALLADLCLPVVDGGEVVAVLNLDAFHDAHAFGHDAFEVIAAFQPLIAFVLRDAELRRRLAVTATTDALTGLPNRRAFDEQAAHALAAAERYGTSMALLIMDMSGFKAVNDKYGHKVGDRVLQEVAAALNAVPRGGDVVYRWGGDEFAALLRNVEREEAEQVGARFSEVVRQLESEAGPLNLSVGAAIYPEDSDSLSGLLEVADARMYESRGVKPRS